MLEARVERLERDVGDIRTKVDRIETTLQRLEILLNDVRANLMNCATKQDIANHQNDIAKIREDGAYVRGRLENIPTFWQIFALISAMLIGIAGITFTAGKFFHP